jgi:catechol 2,3-dioxygenase-like lactoylglutathione lyase family enzyme
MMSCCRSQTAGPGSAGILPAWRSGRDARAPRRIGARRTVTRVVHALSLILMVTALPTAALPSSDAALVRAVDAIGMTVADMDRSVAFYSRVLAFEKVSDVEVAGEAYERLQGVFGLRMRVVLMRLGDESIELTEYLAPRGRPIPPDTRSNDRWFQHIAVIVSDMDRAYRWLRQHRVEHASSGPQRLPDWNKNAGGIRAFYFRDPDGHHLEILQFPPGKGDPKWHRYAEASGVKRVALATTSGSSTDPSSRLTPHASRLFLGIDHTAIVVGDTEPSLRFYRDVLGLRVVGESENYGTEQEHLNNVFGARLRITALRAAAGPGIELLEYLTPRGGRPAPPDRKANDLAHWQTRLVTGDAEALARRLWAEMAAFISPGLVGTVEGQLGFRKGGLIADPDGHAVQLVEAEKGAGR